MRTQPELKNMTDIFSLANGPSLTGPVNKGVRKLG